MYSSPFIKIGILQISKKKLKKTVSLDISETLDALWQDILIFKLKKRSVSGGLLKTVTDVLPPDRTQIVISNGQNCAWMHVKAGVFQGNILKSLLFLIYSKDFPDNLLSNSNLFTDDTSLFAIVNDKHCSTNHLNDDLSQIRDKGLKSCKMSLKHQSHETSSRTDILAENAEAKSAFTITNNSIFKQMTSQKHLQMLDTKHKTGLPRSFEEHENKLNRSIGL